MISVLFDNGCGEDAVCQTNLAVHAELVDITTPYVLDPKIPLKVKVSVVSLKEPAYQSQITLETSGEVMLEKMLSSCQQLLGIPALHLKCTLGHRPLTQDSRSVVVVLELGVSKLSSSTEELVFNITAESSGVEQTPANNIALLSLRVFTDSQPILVGKPRPATLYFSQQTDDVMFTHVYEVRNSGPSPMAAVDLEFLVPATAVVGGKSTQGVYIDGITGQIGTRRLNCTSQSRVAGEVAVVSGSDTTLQLSCEQRPASCAVVTCWGVGPFPTTHSVAIISIYLRAPPAALASLIGQGKFIQISSVGRAKYLLPKNSIHFYRNSSEQGTLQAVATATSMLIADVAVEKVEPWILLLAILAGVLILLMIVLGMYKVGFFRRRCHNYGPLQEGTVTSNDGVSAATSSRESIPLSHY